MSNDNSEQKILNAFDKEMMKGIIAETIQVYFPGSVFEPEELEKILNGLNPENPTIASLKNRNHDDSIIIMANEIVRKKSCIGNNSVPFASKKKKITLKEFLKYFAVLLLTAQLVYGIVTLHINKEIRNETIANLAASGYSVSNIVNYGETKMYDSSGDVYYTYDEKEIANMINEEAQGNDIARDVAIKEVFEDIKDNEWSAIDAVQHMDEIIANLHIDDCSTFLEYLIQSGFINEEHKNYDKIVEIAKKLKTGGSIHTLDFDEQIIFVSVAKSYDISMAPYLNAGEEAPNQGGRK